MATPNKTKPQASVAVLVAACIFANSPGSRYKPIAATKQIIDPENIKNKPKKLNIGYTLFSNREQNANVPRKISKDTTIATFSKKYIFFCSEKTPIPMTNTLESTSRQINLTNTFLSFNSTAKIISIDNKIQIPELNINALEIINMGMPLQSLELKY